MNKVSRAPKMIDEYEEALPPLASAIGFSSTAFLVNEIANYFGVWNAHTTAISFRYAIIIISFASLAAAVGLFIGRAATYKLWFHGHYPFLLLNKGDRRNFSVFQNESNKQIGRWKKIIGAAVAAVALNLLAGSILNWFSVM